MVPENGSFTFISHATLDANGSSTTPTPKDVTHVVLGSTSNADTYGILAVRFDGTNLNKILVPLGQFIRLTGIVNTPTVVTNFQRQSSDPASSVISITFYKWEA